MLERWTKVTDKIDILPEKAKDKTESAADFLPAKISFPSLFEAAKACKGCELYQDATQTVFGEGATHAGLMLVGEQPGNDEDLAGHPFVGPAGQILAKAMEEVGIARNKVYITNAVKHFRFEARGKSRLHKTPSARHIKACRPWLNAEIDLIKPQAILCLGATAAQSLLGASFSLMKNLETWQEAPLALAHHQLKVMASFHPSAALRAPDPARREEIYANIVSSMRAASHVMHAA